MPFINSAQNRPIYGTQLSNTSQVTLLFSKLINKSVRGTVDLRALTKTPPPSASSADLLEAIEENMLLVVESARAIGCSVSENMPDELVSGDHNAIDKLLLELIRVSWCSFDV